MTLSSFDFKRPNLLFYLLHRYPPGFPGLTTDIAAR